MVLNRDEPTFEESIKSIAPYVDDIIVSDASKNDYPKVRRICEEQGAQLYKMNPHIPSQADFVYSKVKTRWALRWDADFVAMPEINQLLQFAKAIRCDSSSYAFEFGVYDEDNKIEHFEIYLFTIRDDLLKPRIRKMTRRLNRFLHGKPYTRFKWMPFPIDYNIIHLKECYAYHLQNKPNWKKIERKYQVEWGLLPAQERNKTTYEEYVKRMEKQRSLYAS